MKIKCNICGGVPRSLMTYKDFPVTGIYAKECTRFNYAQDLTLQLCSNCGHGQLAEAYLADELYGSDYCFRTSESATASKGVSFFVNNLKRLFPEKKFNKVLDLGCNDGYLLEQLEGLVEQRFGVDLIWAGRELAFTGSDITVFGKHAEELDLIEDLNGMPDLIVSQHTMEHVDDPKPLLSSLLSAVDQNTYFLFEFPSLEMLVKNYRFDHVFHQHVQYYSVSSFGYLLNELGAEILDVRFNEHYWGGVHILFRKSACNKNHLSVIPFSMIKKHHMLFENQMKITSETIHQVKESGHDIFGYGAALMLPSLYYLLGISEDDISVIYDDDPKKHGLTYANLGVQIYLPEKLDFRNTRFLLTAIDNRRPIMNKLISKQANTIINPLSVM